MAPLELLAALLLNPLTALAMTWLVAKGTSALVERRLRSRWRHIAATMPGLPPRKHHEGEPGQRFDRALSEALPGVLGAIRAQPVAVEAASLSATTGISPELAAAALETVADHVRHELRVTRSGRLLYDFEDADFSGVEQLLLRPALGRLLGLFALTLANIGTAWPLIATLGVAAACAWQAVSGDVVFWLGLALCISGFLFGLTWGLAKLVGQLAAPPDQPDFIAPVGEASIGCAGPGFFETWLSTWWSDDEANESSAASSGEGAVTDRPDKRGAGENRLGDIADWVISAITEIRDIRFLVVAVVVAVFAVAVLSTFATLLSWLAGLWKAVNERALSLSDIAPGDWVRHGARPSGLSALAPTTDVAGRVVRAVSHALTGTRPGDVGLPRRLHALAAAHGGRVAALDIAIAEGLDLEEALSIGTRVAVERGGRVEVSDAGDVLFIFRPSAGAAQGVAPWEILDPNEGFSALGEGVAVNVAGLTDQHLAASDRLAGGALLMLFAAPLVLAVFTFELGVALDILLWPALFLLPLSMATTALAAAARTTATIAAKVGLLRDTRRATMTLLVKALREGRSELRASDVTQQLELGLQQAWPGLPQSRVSDEVVRALEQLDVAMDVDASAAHGGDPTFLLHGLRARKESLQRLDGLVVSGADAGDEVVYDTRRGR